MKHNITLGTQKSAHRRRVLDMVSLNTDPPTSTTFLPLQIADVGVVAVVGVVVRVAVALLILILHTHTSTSSQLYYATENNMNIIYNCTTNTKNTQVQLHCDTVNWTVNWDMASHIMPDDIPLHIKKGLTRRFSFAFCFDRTSNTTNNTQHTCNNIHGANTQHTCGGANDTS